MKKFFLRSVGNSLLESLRSATYYSRGSKIQVGYRKQHAAENRQLILLVLITIITLSFPSFSKSVLYPQEQVMEIAGAQTLTYFQKGSNNKPLIIFIPGDSHLARIAYGYPKGEPKDFLAYWLHHQGYSFLGLSYPLDNPVYNKKYPNFTIKQWGEQIAQTAEYFIKKYGLSKKIIVIGWSMAGAVEQTIYQASQKYGLDMDVFIGLAAVPPLPFIMQSGSFDTNLLRKDYLADRSKLIPWFIQQLNLQNAFNEHVIIPESIYLSEFIGHIPTAISAEGYYIDRGVLKKNNEMTYKDSGVFNFSNTPWIALIIDDTKEDAKISLIDPYSWNFIRAEMLYQRYIKYALTTKSWDEIQNLVNKLPEQLIATVHGTHFFFVGKKGAQRTADQITMLIDRVNNYKTLFSNLLSEPRSSAFKADER